MKNDILPRVLIANRGEIAIRGIRACQKIGYKTVAIYSKADKTSPHAWLADEAVCIGPPQSNLSYLNIDAILHVAKTTNCSLIYPGYGFLAENFKFAERCLNEGLTFIGPSPDNIEIMGDKARARSTANQLNIPVVPGTEETFTNYQTAKEAAINIGFPLLLKASAGGGGRGMRIVEDMANFNLLFQQASREAKDAFSDPSLYMERYLPKVRHIEVQIFGDNKGNVCQLGERECSIQRRHQKLIEETPSIILSNKEREKVLEFAVLLAQSINYTGAGTVEFIFDEESREFYFIEMNTRIQVEHTVTEMYTGHDLIVEQIKVSLGEKLSIPKPDEWPGGHAIEFRINAENTLAGFQPSPGMLTQWKSPKGDSIRLDTFVYEGMKIQPFYDSLIGKLIIHEKNRSSVLETAKSAFDLFSVSGIVTTIPFHRAVLNNTDFISNNIYTRWVEEQFLPKFSMRF